MAKLKDRYANALLELSQENGTLEEDLRDAVVIRDVLNKNDILSFLMHPHVPDSAKHELFDSAFSGKVSSHLLGFLYLMVGKSRESIIVPALTEYIDRAYRLLGIIKAKVVSAKALTEEQLESIRRILSKKTKMQVEINAIVDPDVIGGFYVLMDGRIFDRTVRSELNILKERLKRGR